MMSLILENPTQDTGQPLVQTPALGQIPDQNTGQPAVQTLAQDSSQTVVQTPSPLSRLLSVLSNAIFSILSRLLKAFLSLLSALWSLIRKKNPAADDVKELRIYAHSTLLYWWPVWLYASFCWALTAVDHVLVDQPGLMPVKVFPSPWLGISFLCVLFFVITFTNVRTRGFQALYILMAVALLLGTAYFTVGLTPLHSASLFSAIHRLAVYTNEAFYGVVAISMFALWAVVFALDHLTYYRFEAGQVIEEHILGQSDRGGDLSAQGMVVRRKASDPFRHKILGLSILFDTGDFICRRAGDDPLVIENVIGLSHKLQEIQKIIANANRAEVKGQGSS